MCEAIIILLTNKSLKNLKQQIIYRLWWVFILVSDCMWLFCEDWWLFILMDDYYDYDYDYDYDYYDYLLLWLLLLLLLLIWSC